MHSGLGLGELLTATLGFLATAQPLHSATTVKPLVWAATVLPLQSTTTVQPLQSTATVAVAALFPALTWLTLAVWVYQDARARNSDHPTRSAVTVAIVPLALIAYVYYRNDRIRPQSDAERLSLTILLALLSAMMAGTVFSPPDVFAQPRNTFGALLVMLPLFYLIVYKQEAEPEADTDSADD